MWKRVRNDHENSLQIPTIWNIDVFYSNVTLYTSGFIVTLNLRDYSDELECVGCTDGPTNTCMGQMIMMKS